MLSAPHEDHWKTDHTLFMGEVKEELFLSQPLGWGSKASPSQACDSGNHYQELSRTREGLHAQCLRWHSREQNT